MSDPIGGGVDIKPTFTGLYWRTCGGRRSASNKIVIDDLIGWSDESEIISKILRSNEFLLCHYFWRKTIITYPTRLAETHD